MNMSKLALGVLLVSLAGQAQDLPPTDSGTETTTPPTVVDVTEPDSDSFDDAVGGTEDPGSENGGDKKTKKSKKAKKPHPKNFGAIVSAKAHELKGDREAKKGFGQWVKAERRVFESVGASKKSAGGGSEGSSNENKGRGRKK